MSEPNFKQQEQDGRADFDFFIGSWKCQHRCLREWLKGSTSWEEFSGTSVARKVLGGLGHIEEVTLERASGTTEELVVRLFDPQTQQWSIYEADNTNGFDPRPPAVSSGLRIGTPALATRGLAADDFVEIGRIIAEALTAEDFDARQTELAERAGAIAERYPLYASLSAAAAV